MCKTMLNDYYIAKSLKEEYPECIFTVRYETLQDSKFETIANMFEFLELPFLDSVKKFIRGEERNSSKLPDWRKHISQKHLDVVNKYCEGLYEIFGYTALNSTKEVRNVKNKDHMR